MPLRRLLLYMAHHRGLRRWMETSSASRRLSRRFIAGNTLEEALAVCAKLRAEGITATLDYLGENVTSISQAEASRDIAIRTLRALGDAGLEPNISLKLSQFGMDISSGICEANTSAVVEAAATLRGFVRVDMESSDYTERTLDLVQNLHARFGACGTVLQAYLHRTSADLETLVARGIRIRLCKGAYLESPEVALANKAEVDANYLKLARSLLDRGNYPALATHDERIVGALRQYVSEHHIPLDRFEFQMLYGIRRDLQRKLVKQGYRVRVYVPFGDAWYPYFMRRLAERPANLLFLVRNFFRQ